MDVWVDALLHGKTSRGSDKARVRKRARWIAAAAAEAVPIVWDGNRWQ